MVKSPNKIPTKESKINKKSRLEEAHEITEWAQENLLEDLKFESEEQKERFLKQKEFIDKLIEGENPETIKGMEERCEKVRKFRNEIEHWGYAITKDWIVTKSWLL